MNSSRPGALPKKSKWRPALLYTFILLAATPLFSAPSKTKAALNARVVQSDILPPADLKSPAKDLLLSPADEKKADALAYFIDGSLAEDNADVEQALESYRKALAVDPAARVRTGEGDAPTLLAAKVAFELARRGDPGAGIDILKDTAKADPKEATTYYFLSQIYSRFLKKNDIALKYAEQAIGLDPNNFSFYVADFELCQNLGQTKKAADVLERASKLQNTDPQFWLKLCELHIQTLVKDDGSTAPDDLKKLNALFKKTLSLAKDDPLVIAKVADYYALTRQVKDAIPLYLRALSLKPDTNDPAILNVREKLATSFLATGQRDEAIKALQDLIKASPTRYETYELLGQLFEAKGDFDQALASYQQTLLINPNSYQNYLRVAGAFLQLKKFDKAADLLREARGKFPDMPRITYALGQALSLAKQHQQALATFEEALHEAENNESELLDAEFFFSYGAASEQAGMYDKAAELFKKSIEMDPANSSKALNYLGFMWVDHDQHLDEAGGLIKRAVEMEPDNGAFLDSLGWFYFKKGDYENALAELLKAASVTKPDDATVFDHIADTYQKLGNAAQALVYWQKSVALDPDNKTVAGKLEDAKQKMTARPQAEEKPGEKR
jgi:tetratricopeptide (TPR) repeat protein